MRRHASSELTEAYFGRREPGECCCSWTRDIPVSSRIWKRGTGWRAAGHAASWGPRWTSCRARSERNAREIESLFDIPVLLVSVQTGEGLDELWKTIARLPKPTAA